MSWLILTYKLACQASKLPLTPFILGYTFDMRKRNLEPKRLPL